MISPEVKRRIFIPLAETFELDEFREYYLDMVEQIPDYIFWMPSSTSGKYHNKTQCEKYGQIYHEYMFHSILEHRLRLKGNKEKFNMPEVRDSMRCVPTFHDAIKCGLDGSKYTVQDHPLQAAEWVRNAKVKHDIDKGYKELIARMCESHSGEWNKNRSGQEIMPEPRNEMEFFIHECDILSSRNDIDMIIPDILLMILAGEDIEEPLPDINTYLMPFGKYKGKTIPEIKSLDSQYFSWAKENMTKEPVKSLLQQIV